jgi:DNA-binding Lrp family transcriptional regulator
MKIAICFSGQIRTGVQTEPNIKRYIGDLLPICDFFVHTWDHQSPPHTANALMLVDKSVFADFRRLYNPKSMTVEEYLSKRAPDGIWGGYRVDASTKKKYISMFESIYKANELKRLYEKSNGFVYDYVVRIRTDLIFHQDKSLRADITELFSKTMTTFDNFMIAYHHGVNYSKLEDIFWLAKSPTMDKLAKFYEHYATNEGDWQVKMANWVKNDLKLAYYGLQNSNIRLLRVDNSGLDPLNYDAIPV